MSVPSSLMSSLISSLSVPKRIERPEDPSLGWNLSFANEYQFPKFVNGLVLYNQSSSARPLPEGVQDVIKSIILELSAMYSQTKIQSWLMDWNKDTPAIQFHNPRGLISESLPLGNIFHCSLENDYFYGACEQTTKKIAEETLFHHNREWWEDRFGSYTHREVVQNPIILSTKPNAMRQRYTDVVYSDGKGNTLKKTTLTPDEIPKDLVFEVEKRVSLINNGEVLDTFNPITNTRVISVDKIRKDALQYLSRLWKIRLQVRPEYQIWLVCELIRLFTLSDAGRYVEAFKCTLPYSQIVPDGLASIVIYVTPCSDISGIISLLKRIPEEIGLDFTSRYNFRVNKLITFSQCDGDLKNLLKRAGLLERFFDKTKNYAFLNGAPETY